MGGPTDTASACCRQPVGSAMLSLAIAARLLPLSYCTCRWIEQGAEQRIFSATQSACSHPVDAGVGSLGMHGAYLVCRRVRVTLLSADAGGQSRVLSSTYP